MSKISATLLAALAISIYDSPTDKSKVVVEVCTSTCHVLITDKATLEADYDRILTWAVQITAN